MNISMPSIHLLIIMALANQVNAPAPLQKSVSSIFKHGHKFARSGILRNITAPFGAKSNNFHERSITKFAMMDKETEASAQNAMMQIMQHMRAMHAIVNPALGKEVAELQLAVKNTAPITALYCINAGAEMSSWFPKTPALVQVKNLKPTNMQLKIFSINGCLPKRSVLNIVEQMRSSLNYYMKNGVTKLDNSGDIKPDNKNEHIKPGNDERTEPNSDENTKPINTEGNNFGSTGDNKPDNDEGTKPDNGEGTKPDNDEGIKPDKIDVSIPNNKDEDIKPDNDGSIKKQENDGSIKPIDIGVFKLGIGTTGGTNFRNTRGTNFGNTGGSINYFDMLDLFTCGCGCGCGCGFACLCGYGYWQAFGHKYGHYCGCTFGCGCGCGCGTFIVGVYSGMGVNCAWSKWKSMFK